MSVVRFNDETRTRILLPAVVTTFDPATATVELKIDATWYACDWTAAVTTTGSGSSQTWTRAARTTLYFAGPVAVPSGATVLALGRHMTETRVTNGADIITAPSSLIEVVAR